MSCCECRGAEEQGSILFSLLNRGAAGGPRGLRLCSCASDGRLVSVRAPHLVFKAASEVLEKTFRFVKNVPCFRGLPAEDQVRLVRRSWAPLLLLGFVQDCVHFDTVETRRPSLLHRILTRQQRAPPESRHPGVPVRDAEGVRAFLLKCRGLRISVKEHALLKGAVLFTAEVSELQCLDYINALRREAERALYAHVRAARGGRAGRCSRLRAVLSALRAVDQEVVAGLFIRPVTGTSSTEEHVLAMFHER